MWLRVAATLFVMEASVAEELVELVPGEWALWRTMVVRATGFPVAGLEVFGPGEEARIARLAENRRFREALTWQNRDVVRNALDRVGSSEGGSDHRRRLRSIASYWQRYCAKNDTIGFFGPIGWGRLADDGPAIVDPGPTLLAARHTRFEVWAIDALASALVADREVRRWIPPRRHPGFVTDRLGEKDRDLCRACDGRPAVEVGPLDEIESLVERGALVLAFEVPLGPHPERDLRRQLEAIGDVAVRARCLAALDQLEQARAGVAGSAGDPDALEAALAALDETFESLTGASATRRAGEMYAGRTVCYEDCRRDLALQLGPDVVAELGRALIPVLASSRWYCGEIWAAGQQLVAEALAEVRATLGATRVPLAEVWRAALPRLMPPSVRREMPQPFGSAQEVALELQRRWSDLLAGDLDTLADRARSSFADARPAWPQAAFHGPDVQIAAAGTQAIDRGEFRVVVGDFHPGTAPVGQTLFLEGHPEPDRVRRFLSTHVPEPRLIFIRSRSMARTGGRFANGYGTERDLYVRTTDETCAPAGYPAFDMADMWVDDIDGKPMILAQDRALAPLGHAFEHIVFIAGIRSYQPFVNRTHSPRIEAGRVVFRREMWTIPAGDVIWTDAARARSWAQAASLPRRVFALVDGEPKPIYVDFDSPALIAILAHQIRRAANPTVRFSEMLPAPDQTWLTDAAGHLYTSELRLTAVDLRQSPAFP